MVYNFCQAMHLKDIRINCTISELTDKKALYAPCAMVIVWTLYTV